MKNYVVLTPGDWPAQFYVRQAVYSSLYPNGKAKPKDDNPVEYVVHDQDHYLTLILHSTTHATGTSWTEEMQSIVPLMGPLHISINAREDICEVYHPFMKYLYEQLFPGCQLAKKPKPWRTTLLIEIIYGGWTIIRASAITSFSKCKLMQYGILLNLLDNYLPLVLIIYAISFKENKFDEYFKAVIRVWTMFYCFHRKHYDKAPLVWISKVGHWARNYNKLYKTLQKNISCTDEYPVENAHSVIRSQTNPSDECETISKKAKMIFTSKAELKNFKTAFTPPKTFSFTRNVLHALKVKAAQLIGNILKLTTETEGENTLRPN